MCFRSYLIFIFFSLRFLQYFISTCLYLNHYLRFVFSRISGNNINFFPIHFFILKRIMCTIIKNDIFVI